MVKFTDRGYAVGYYVPNVDQYGTMVYVFEAVICDPNWATAIYHLKEMRGEKMIIAIDFDGTVVTHHYPDIGTDIRATPVLKELVRQGHRLILYTMRSGDTLDAAINWFKEREIEIWSVNSNPTQLSWTFSPKVYANLYIDDAALGIPLLYPGFGRPHVDWVAAEALLRRAGVLR